LQSLGDELGSDQRAYGVLYNTLLRQASLWSYVDNFRLFVLICVISALLVVLFRKVRSRGGVAVH
jgi:DHA2 family multidrug resistance protein